MRGCVLPGGKHRDRGRLFKAVSRADPDALAAKLAGYRVESYTRFQMKVGDDPHRSIDRIRRVAKEVRAGDILVAGCEHEPETARSHARRGRGRRPDQGAASLPTMNLSDHERRVLSGATGT